MYCVCCDVCVSLCVMCVLIWESSILCECVVCVLSRGCCVLSVCLFVLCAVCSKEFIFVYVMLLYGLCLLCVVLCELCCDF